MKVEKLVCDECGKVQGEANHWTELTSWTSKSAGTLAIAVGMCADQLVLERVDPPVEPEVWDLCGQQCFYKKVGKLLRINPAPEAE